MSTIEQKSLQLNRVAYLVGWYAVAAEEQDDRALSMLCADLAEALQGVGGDEVQSPPRLELWEAMQR